MRMRNACGLLMALAPALVALPSCGRDSHFPDYYEYAYAAEQENPNPAWEDCHIAISEIFVEYHGEDIFNNGALLPEFMGLGQNEAGMHGRWMPDGAKFQKCTRITFLDPGPGLDGPYYCFGILSSNLMFNNLDGEQMNIRLLGEHGENGISLFLPSEDHPIDFTVVQ